MLLFLVGGNLVAENFEGGEMGKRIVLCADGTWNTPHGVDVAVNDTNVRKLYCALTSVPEQLS